MGFRFNCDYIYFFTLHAGSRKSGCVWVKKKNQKERQPSRLVQDQKVKALFKACVWVSVCVTGACVVPPFPEHTAESPPLNRRRFCELFGGHKDLFPEPEVEVMDWGTALWVRLLIPHHITVTALLYEMVWLEELELQLKAYSGAQVS